MDYHYLNVITITVGPQLFQSLCWWNQNKCFKWPHWATANTLTRQSTVELASLHYDCLSHGSEHLKCSGVSYLVFSISAGTIDLVCALANKNLR